MLCSIHHSGSPNCLAVSPPSPPRSSLHQNLWENDQLHQRQYQHPHRPFSYSYRPDRILSNEEIPYRRENEGNRLLATTCATCNAGMQRTRSDTMRRLYPTHALVYRRSGGGGFDQTPSPCADPALCFICMELLTCSSSNTFDPVLLSLQGSYVRVCV